MTYGDPPTPEAPVFPRPFGSKYVLLKHLATGGMADVFLARQTGSAGFVKECVIKRILPHHARDQQFVTMFLDEARLCARLTHPYIAQVYDLGQVGDDFFIAMEYVHGVDLENVLEVLHQRGEKRMPPAMAARIVASAAEALEHAHNAVDALGRPLGIVHRDVTPSNIVVSFEGVPKLLDFGIAKASHKQFKTEVGVVRGKAPYMSPEQVEGEELDRRSDLFSLGAMLYELTTGQKPFDAETSARIAIKILQDEPMPPGMLVPDYPEALADTVMAALTKRREARIATAREFQTQLEKFLISLGTPATTHDVANYIGERFPKQRIQVTVATGAPPATAPPTVAGRAILRPVTGVGMAEPGDRPPVLSVSGEMPVAGSVLRPGPVARTDAPPPQAEFVNEAIARVRLTGAMHNPTPTGMPHKLVVTAATMTANGLQPAELPEIVLGDAPMAEESVYDARSALDGRGGGRWMVLVIVGLVLSTGLGLLALRSYQLRKEREAAAAAALKETPSPAALPPSAATPPVAAPNPGAGPAPAAPAAAAPPAVAPAPSATPPTATATPPAAAPATTPPPGGATTTVPQPTAAPTTTPPTTAAPAPTPPAKESTGQTRPSKPATAHSSRPSSRHSSSGGESAPAHELPRLPSPPPTDGE
ncbi:MAG TPA: serine/threonine-protein kinase [Polyangia bacterium]|nr:serine/threonine-protein kinase [Polyangia bacterium]